MEDAVFLNNAYYLHMTSTRERFKEQWTHIPDGSAPRSACRQVRRRSDGDAGITPPCFPRRISVSPLLPHFIYPFGADSSALAQSLLRKIIVCLLLNIMFRLWRLHLDST